MRTSKNEIVKILFLNPLSKTGNLTVAYNHQMPVNSNTSQRSKWGAALVAEKQRAKVNFIGSFFLIQKLHQHIYIYYFFLYRN